VNRFLLTPVKNEGHLLGAFLDHHACLFDKIIIADQGSSDGTWEIAASHPKVVAIRNANVAYNENMRRQLLLQEARKLDPSALLVGLDADEFMLVHEAKWAALCKKWVTEFSNHSIEFPWMCLAPKGVEWFALRNTFCRPCDGGHLLEMAFHQPRVPLGPESYFCDEICILHLNLLWPRRQQMKTWWYAAVEANSFGSVSIDTRRMYQRSGRGDFPNRQRVPSQYQPRVAAILAQVDLCDTWDTWHKEQVMDILQGDSAGKLKSAPIWDYPWQLEMAAVGRECHTSPSLFGTLVDYWIASTMKVRQRFVVRLVDAVLRLLPAFRAGSELRPNASA